MKDCSSTLKTVVVTLGRSLERIVLLGSTILLSRYLTQNDYGTYRQVFLISGLLITALNFGIPNSINYFLPFYSKDKQKSFLLQTILFQLFLGVLASSALWFGSGQIANIFDNPELIRSLRLFSLYPLFILPSMSYSNIFICINKVKLAGVLSPILGLIQLTLVVVSVLLKYSLSSLLLLLLLAAFLQFILIMILLYKSYYKVHFSLSFSEFLNQLQFSTPIGLATIIGVAIVKIDQIMVSSFFSVEEYAVYSVGALELPFINMITISAMAVITPYLVTQKKSMRMDLFMQKWRNSIIKLSYIIFPVAIFFLFFAHETIVVLYSNKYEDSSIIFQIYLLKLLVKVTFFGHILLALGKSKKILQYTLITLVVNVALNLLFIKIFGFIGAATATVFSAFLISFLQLKEISKIINIKIKEIWPWNKMFLILSLSILAALCANIVKILLVNKILVLAGGLLLFVSAYFLFSQIIFKKSMPANLHLVTILSGIKSNEKE
ncbi:MAG: oligosaccharide flippase family protein [Candidatus Cloacimonadales bacterium]|nr:oligosaccharide flippase family protein [Candidatus Cloacimonadales bacterium]